MMDLTISIGSLGKIDLLRRCLRSVFEEDAPGFSFEVRIVYNGPGGDGVCESIPKEFPQVALSWAARAPLGYCGTHNVVLRDASGRYVLLLDDDTILPKGTLPAMVRFMDEHPRAGIAGCKTLNSDGSFQPTFGLRPNLKTEVRNIFKSTSYLPASLYREVDSVRHVEFLNGHFLLARSEAVRQVGVLDEYYYTHISEADWCYRLEKAGWQVLYVPVATIVHTGGEYSTVNSRSAMKKYEHIVRAHVNRFYFFHKHYSPWKLFALRPVMALSSAARVLFFSVIYLIHRDQRPIAATRVRAFRRIIGISFSRRPYRIP